MQEEFTTYLSKLERLSTEELDRSAMELVLAEKQSAARVIAHIAEIARRKGALERGHASLFDYCVRRLGLSEGSVALRIQVANVCRRFPQVLSALAAGKIRLSVAGRLAPHLREDTVEKLLRDAAGMTKREVEEYLVALSPRPVFTPSIRKLPSRAEGGARSQPDGKGAAALPIPERSPAPPAPLSLLEPARSEVYNFRFAASRGFKEKLLRLAEVLGIENAEANLAGVLERALDLALERKDPRLEHERRCERERRRLDRAGEPRPGEDSTAPPAPCAPPLADSSGRQSPSESRYLPRAVRGRVLERAGHRCEFTGPGGTRCASRTGLEIEHCLPFAIFHSHDESRLQALCKAHNTFRAERAYGAGFMRRKIEERRRRSGEAQSGAPERNGEADGLSRIPPPRFSRSFAGRRQRRSLATGSLDPSPELAAVAPVPANSARRFPIPPLGV